VELLFTANPQPKVAWTYNAGAIPDPKRMKVQTINNMTSLMLTKIVEKDAGDYKATLTNEHGQSSLNVKLTVVGMLITPLAVVPIHCIRPSSSSLYEITRFCYLIVIFIILHISEPSIAIVFTSSFRIFLELIFILIT